MDDVVALAWQAIGRYSSDICRPEVELAPPGYLLDAMNAVERALGQQAARDVQVDAESEWLYGIVEPSYYAGSKNIVKWTNGEPPPVGTKLYAAPPASDVQPVGAVADERVRISDDQALSDALYVAERWPWGSSSASSEYISNLRSRIAARAAAPASLGATVADERAFDTAFFNACRAYALKIPEGKNFARSVYRAGLADARAAAPALQAGSESTHESEGCLRPACDPFQQADSEIEPDGQDQRSFGPHHQSSESGEVGGRTAVLASSVQRSECDVRRENSGADQTLANGAEQPAAHALQGKSGATVADQRDAAGWISVEDRLPKDGTICLVAVIGGVVIDTWQMQREAPLSFSSATIETGLMWDDHEFEEITHWMPLPSLPPQPELEQDAAGERS